MFLHQPNTPVSVLKSSELLLPKDAVYLASSSIKGQVVLILKRALADPTVKVELVGRGYVHWIEDIRAPCDYSRDGIIFNKADYMHKTKTLPLEGNRLSAGSHTFEFHFKLPPRIPSTFESSVGRISYFVQASCRSPEYTLVRKKMYLMIQGTSDFGRKKTLQNPLVAEAEKVCYNCLRRGTICLRFQVEKNTFTPGERVIFITEINNQTGKCIRTVTSALCVHMRYEGFTRTGGQRSWLSSSELVQQKKVNIRVMPFSTTTFAGAFSLPHVLSVSINARDGEPVSFQYQLVGTIRVPWSLASVRARLPITISSPPVDADT
ncbi:hypothetical protein MC885_011402 [Smutsia gigantea]|nr:hypothetical protein MC885_011402 [Smutsia gigantea]